MTLCRVGIILALSLLSACVQMPEKMTNQQVQEQVFQTEQAFAASMAQRDFEAFARFIDAEAVFFSGPKVLRGRQAVLEAWAAYFEPEQAPFAWTPDQVEVLDSGALAHSSGPVMGPNGEAFARFNSIWRRNANGQWRIVFDKGSPLETKE